MFKRKEVNKQKTGKWPALAHRKLLAIFVLLLCSTLFSGCRNTSTTAATSPQSQPQPTVAARPFHAATQTFDKDFSLTLDITPDRSGMNTFVMHAMDNRTNKPATHVIITLYTTMQDMAMGTDSVTLHEDGNGQFSVASGVLSMAGHWAIGITVQTTDHVIHEAGVSFVMPQ